MSREKVKALLPVIQAYAEGKDIQIMQIDDETDEEVWLDINPWRFDACETYRIKPEVPYRPFEDAEECWSEMQEHQPFGWLRAIELGTVAHVDYLDTEAISFAGCDCATFERVFNRYTFADGTPFGIKEGGEE